MANESVNEPDEYVINPCLTLTTAVLVRTRLGLSTAELDVDDPDHREVARAVRSPGASLESLHLDKALRAVLIEAGLAVRRRDMPTTPKLELCLETLLARESVFLDNDAESLQCVDDLSPNGDVWIGGIDENADRRLVRIYSPAQEIVSAHAGEGSSIFVKDPRTGFVSLYHLSPRLHDLWQRLTTGAVGPRDLTAADRRGLAAAKLLVLRGASAQADRLIAEAGAELRANGYVVLRNLVNAVSMAALGEYVMSLEHSGYLTRGDSQVDSRWASHNEPVMRVVHWLIEPLISAITAAAHRPSRASYSNLALYERGSVLRRHTDRPECRWNVSLCLGTRPHVVRERQWPIYLSIGDSVHEVRLGLSDALLYSGTETPHWRDELVECDRYAACFFHFVDLDFLGPTE